MKLNIDRVDVWAADVEDPAGGLAEKLGLLARAGVNLEFVMARRSPEKPGTGVVFARPFKGVAQLKAADQAGFAKSESLYAVRVTVTDKPGLGAKITEQIASAGINLRGLSAMAIGRRATFYIAFDSAADANKALRCLNKIS
jgi:hypothetical protein